MNQIENNSTPTPTTTSRRLSLDSGMDRLRGKFLGSAADLSNQARAAAAAVRPHHRLLDLYHGSHATNSNYNNYNNHNNYNNTSTTSRQRRRAQAAAWAEADLLLATATAAGENVEITGLELLMMCDEMNEFDYYKQPQPTTERDYDDDDDSISMVSYEISCSSMDSIANDSIDLARERQQKLRSQQQQQPFRRSHSISQWSVSAEEGEERISYHRLESRSSDNNSCKVSNDSASCSSKSVYSVLFASAEQIMQDFSETVTINTNGTNRAA